MSKTMRIVEDFRNACYLIETLNKHLNYLEDTFDYSKATEEERSFVKHLRRMAIKPFDETNSRLNSMFAPVFAQGRLFKNNSGRYEIEGTDIYFTSGSGCEVYLPYNEYDEDGEYMTWIPTTIEHSNGYYFTARPDIPLDGAMVRVKK